MGKYAPTLEVVPRVERRITPYPVVKTTKYSFHSIIITASLAILTVVILYSGYWSLTVILMRTVSILSLVA